MTTADRRAASGDARLVQILDEYLAAAQAGHAPDRRALLARHPELAAELEACLASLDFIRQAGMSASAAEAAQSEAPAGGVLGDYRIVREVGRGGMGVVYEAEQMSLNRRVALKVLPFASTLDPKRLQRFKNEAQAAASLHHTNIVPVFGTGSAHGVHYYAMQFIDGRPLSTLIRELREAEAAKDEGQSTKDEKEPATPPAAALHPSSLIPHPSPSYYRTVAQLGVQAAEALEHAHQMGVVHRDIKPANLLIDHSPRTTHPAPPHLWITDFGLAQIDTGENLTITGDLLGTLRYMSPEQALAKRVPIDHRTDVYSLGVTLYELLTLEPAFAGRDRQDLLRQIAFEEPRPLRRINKSIPADLETIVLKATEKSAPDRYATAQEMADDLRRFGDDKPIAARRPTLVQHARRWCRRHKAVLASALVCAITAVTALAGSIGWITGDHAARRAAADEKADLAFQEVVALQAQEKWPGALAAVRRAEELLAGGGSHDLLERVRRRRADLDMAARLDDVRLASSSAEKDGAFDIGLRDPAYMRAFREYGVDMSSSPRAAADLIGATSIRVQLAAALDDWAIVCRSTRSERDTTWRELLAIARAADQDPMRNRVRDALERRDLQALQELTASEHAAELPASTVVLLVRVLGDVQAAHRGRSRADMAPSPEGVRLLRRAQQRHPDDFWLNQELAWQLARTEPPQFDEALRFSSVALALRPQSALAQVSLSYALINAGRTHEASACCAEAIRLDPRLAEAHNNLGEVLRHDGRVQDAIASCRNAIRLKPNLASAHNNLGNALMDQHRVQEAIECYRAAIRLKPGAFRAHNNLGNALREKKQYKEAMACYAEAIKLKPGLAEAHSNLAMVLAHTGRPQEAIDHFKEAVRLRPKEAADYERLSDLLRKAGRRQDAIAALKTVVELKPADAGAHSNLGSVLMESGRLPEAIDRFKEAIRLEPGLARAHSNLGAALRRDGRVREAIAAYQDALRLDPELAAAHSNLAWILATAPDETLRDPVQAVAAAKKAVELSAAPPQRATAWQRLGVAYYRAGDARAALDALRKSGELAAGADAVDLFFLAMAHWKLGDKDQAVHCYRAAKRTPAKPAAVPPRRVYQPLEEERRRFHAEAARLLGVKD